MVNDRYDDKYEGQDEGEYHFSDDQVNYDMEGEAPGKTKTTGSALSKQSIIETLKQHPKIVIAVPVLLVLLGLVYKLLLSPPKTPQTEFTPQSAMTSTQVTSKTTQAAPPPAIAQPPAAAQPPLVQPVTAPAPLAEVPPAETVVQPPAAVTMAPPSTPQAPPAPIAQPTAQGMPTSPVVIVNGAPETETSAAQNRTVVDRVTTLEQQNAAMMNLLQTQYAQKMAEYEAQNTQLHTQLQEMTTRLATIEVAFRQLTKMLRSAPPRPPVMGVSERVMAPPRVEMPRMSYTVQAIIPGRAWLKSESGDTVTVAEGDMLKDYGRIVKIDPYDGIVNIDTGNKVLTLSYGVAGD